MDPNGDYVYEVYGTKLYRFSTTNGAMDSFTLSYSGRYHCSTDGQYIYVPAGEFSRTIYKYTMTGAYVNTTTLSTTVEAITSSVCRDTFWASPSVGSTIRYAFPTSRFNGDTINYVTTWNIGGGSSPGCAGNIAYDGTCFYLGWLGASSNTFKRFYSNRTLWTTGTVTYDNRSCMSPCVYGVPGDVGCTRVIGPSDTIQYGDLVIPQAAVTNYSTVPQTFPVEFDIGACYAGTVLVTDLAPGDSATVSFDTWRVLNSGPFTIKCSTQLSSDSVRGNDKATAACFVSLVDAGTRVILAPTGTIPYGVPVAPQALVKNSGTAAATFTARFTIGTFYRDSQTVGNLPAGESLVVNFADWAADTAGYFATRCSIRLSGDQIPGDDMAEDSVLVQLTGVVDSSPLVPHASLSVSPNPLASGFATVSFTGAREHSGAGALRLSVYDIFGRRVLRSSLETRKSPLPLDVRSLPAGVYLVEATAADVSATRKLVVQR